MKYIISVEVVGSVSPDISHRTQRHVCSLIHFGPTNELSIILQTKLLTGMLHFSEYILDIRSHQMKHHHHYDRKQAFVCQCNPLFSCVRFNLPQGKAEAAGRIQLQNSLNSYKSNTNMSFRVLCPLFP